MAEKEAISITIDKKIMTWVRERLVVENRTLSNFFETLAKNERDGDPGAGMDHTGTCPDCGYVGWHVVEAGK